MCSEQYSRVLTLSSSFSAFFPFALASFFAFLSSAKIKLHNLWDISTISLAPHALHRWKIHSFLILYSDSGNRQLGHRTNFSMYRCMSSCNAASVWAPFTTALSFSGVYLDWAPNSVPKNLFTSPGDRCKLFATSVMLGITV